MATKLKVGQETINPERMLERIALEANFMSDMRELMVDFIPALKNKLAAFVPHGQATEYDKYAHNIFMLEAKAKYKADKLDFLTFGANFVSVPIGFNGYLTNYSEELTRAINQCKPMAAQILSTINMQLANCITNKDAVLSIKEDTKIYTEAKNHRDDVNKKLGEYLTGVNTSGKAPMTSVLRRFADISDLAKQTKDVMSAIKPINLVDIKNKITELSSMADLLLDAMKKKETERVSPMVAKTLSMGLFETAAYIEFLSVLYYDAMVLMQTISNLFTTIVEA